MGYIYLVLLTILWGFSYTIVKEGVSQVPTEIFQLWRYLIASLTLLILFRKQLRGLSGKSYLRIVYTIGLSAFFASWFSVLGIEWTTASKAAFMCSVPVILVPLLSYLHFKKQLEPIQWISLSICVFGIVLLTKPYENTFSLGDTVLFLAAIAYAYQYIFVGIYVAEFNPAKITTVQCITVSIGFLTLSGYHLINGKFTPSDFFITETKLWFIIAFVAIFITALAWTLEAFAQKTVSATSAVVIISMEPVFTLISDWVWSGQVMETSSVIGGLLILASTLLIGLRFLLQERGTNHGY